MNVRIQRYEREIQKAHDKLQVLMNNKAEIEQQRAEIDMNLTVTVENMDMLEAELHSERGHSKMLQDELRKLTESLNLEHALRVESETQRNIILDKVPLLEAELD